MKLRRALKGHAAMVELVIAGIIAIAAGFLVSPETIARVDDALIASLSIVLAAALPGVALTAAASRPRSSTPLEARRFGDALAEQVQFWFSFLWSGGGAVALLILGKALDWHLATPVRPNWMPEWTPSGGAWLVVVAVFLMALVTVRTRHLVGAIQSIVHVGTQVQVEEAEAREREMQVGVAAELARMESDPGRGANIEGRQRH